MSTVADIERAISSLPREQWMEIRRWMDAELQRKTTTSKTVAAWPEFLARQKALFGDRVLPDSQAILDEMRGDRF